MIVLPVRRIGVCVPAHNELDSITDCLRALLRAAGRVSCPVSILVVADSCTDGTAELVHRLARTTGVDLQVLPIWARSVGAARAAGMTRLIEELGVPGSWLATTDADSTVPPGWLASQLRHVRAGADLVVGTVAVTDWSAHPHPLRAHVVSEYARRRSAVHGHVHGANLGLTASAYRKVGGFASIVAHEDVLLVQTAQRLGLSISWADDLAVTTSARLVARAPAGFAHYLSLAGLRHQHHRPGTANRPSVERS